MEMADGVVGGGENLDERRGESMKKQMITTHRYFLWMFWLILFNVSVSYAQMPIEIPSPTQAKTAEEFVSEIYQQTYRINGDDLPTALFEPSLKIKIKKDRLKNEEGEIDVLDFDLLDGGQDSDVSERSFKEIKSNKPNLRQVEVSMVNFGKKQKNLFLLITTPAHDFLIYDIIYSENTSLRKLFKLK
jgi:hypothetical protein